MNSIEIFEKHAAEYDEWFEENETVYKSEVLALRDLVPAEGIGLEVGVGTGRFAAPLGIGMGVEPAKTMADMARKRGIDVHEAKRVLKPWGLIIIGMIDKNSPFGRDYERKKATSKFYKYACLHSADQVLSWLESLDFNHIAIHQTIFKSLKEICEVEPFEEGHGKGAFVAIAARKRD